MIELRQCFLSVRLYLFLFLYCYSSLDSVFFLSCAILSVFLSSVCFFFSLSPPLFTPSISNLLVFLFVVLSWTQFPCQILVKEEEKERTCQIYDSMRNATHVIRVYVFLACLSV